MKYLLALFMLASSAAWAAAPSNDAFSRATVVTGNSVSGTNVGATLEIGEPTHANVSGGHSVWWVWTPTKAGTVTIDTVGSSFDTVLAVYTGTTGFGGLRNLAYSEDLAPTTLTSKVRISVKANTAYRIAVDGYNGATGAIKLNIAFDSETADRGENDDYVDRIDVIGEYAVVTGSSRLATTEAGENTFFYDPDDYDPDAPFYFYYSSGSNSLWWTWTAPRTGSVTITNDMVINSAFNGDYLSAILEIFLVNSSTIDGLESFPMGKESSNFAERASAALTLDVTAGQVLQIKTSSWDAEYGANVTLTIQMNSSDVVSNDLFVKRPLVPNTTTNITGSNAEATADVDEPDHAGVAPVRSVWWSWIAPDNGYLTLDTYGSTGVIGTDTVVLDTVLAAYTGTQLSSLIEVASDDDGNADGTSKMRFNVSKGATYQIAVDSKNLGGSIQLGFAFIRSAIVITDQVENTAVNVNAVNAVFTVSNTGAPAVYSWQRKAAGTNAWVHYSAGVTTSPAIEGDEATSTLTISGPVSATMNGDEFRCVITNSVGQVTSKAAKLTVVSLNSFTGGPVSIDTSVPSAPGTTVTYYASGLPSGLSIDKTTGAITGRINAPPGTYTISYWSVVTVGKVKTKSVVSTYTIVVQAFPMAMTGNYEGLLLNTGVPVGKVELSVLGSGVFSGKLSYGGVVTILRGTLVLDSATAPTLGTRTLTLKGGLTLVTNVHSDSTMTATLSNGGLIGAVQVGDGVKLGSYTNLTPTLATMLYTLALVDPSSGPEGSGYASARVLRAGQLTITGKLADGAPLTGSTWIDSSTDGEFRPFLMPYKKSAGYVAGWLPLAPRGAGYYHVPSGGGGVFSWFKPANAKDKAYPGGFGPVALTALMEPWVVPDKSGYLLGSLGLVPADPLEIGNFTLLLDQTGGVSNQGGNPQALPTLMNMSASSKFSVRLEDPNPTNPRKLTMSVNNATGVFTGSFTLIDGRRITTEGVLLQQVSGTTPNDFGRGFFQVPPLKGVPGTTVSGEVKMTGAVLP